MIVRFGTEALLGAGVEVADLLRVPLLGTAYGLLLFTLWHNRSYPGLALAFIGIASNALVIMWNGGYMPVWLPAYAVSGLPGPLNSALHIPITGHRRRVPARPGPAVGRHPDPDPAGAERRLGR